MKTLTLFEAFVQAQHKYAIALGCLYSVQSLKMTKKYYVETTHYATYCLKLERRIRERLEKESGNVDTV